MDQKVVERILATESGSAFLKNLSEDIVKNYGDGKRIYVNRLRFYQDKALEEHMISFK